MTFPTFSTMYSRMYEEAKGQPPFSISIRRAFNRLGNLSETDMMATLSKELNS